MPQGGLRAKAVLPEAPCIVAIGLAAVIVRAASAKSGFSPGFRAWRTTKIHWHPQQRRPARMITPAYAQGVGGASPDMLYQLLPFALIFAIMYFLILRPQQKRAKQHQEMVKNVRRGDVLVTSGGLVGKVTKVVDDDQVEIEIADGVRVRQVRSMVTDVRAKSEPVKDDKGG
jgi:preprotein translocase subunit YajC